MGAMNRHPSCKHTWQQTTLAAKCVSNGHAMLLLANGALEDVLLAEFAGARDETAAEQMLVRLMESMNEFVRAQALIRMTIETALKNPDDFVEARERLSPDELSLAWHEMVAGDQADVREIASSTKEDRLATAKIFVDELEEIVGYFRPVIDSFDQARTAAVEGRLREFLETNAIPLQRNFGHLYSRVLEFQRRYLIDSLVATQISFDQREHPPLVSAA